MAAKKSKANSEKKIDRISTKSGESTTDQIKSKLKTRIQSSKQELSIVKILHDTHFNKLG